jgi:hypothetical protein
MQKRSEQPQGERGADEALERLREAERKADETLREAAEELEEVTEEQEKRAERLRKEVREPTGPLLPPEPPRQ